MNKEVIDSYFESKFEKYVPEMGAANTVGGEIVRAVNRIIYRWWNDGDIPGRGYGNETCNSSDRYLERVVPMYVNLRDEYVSEDKYESLMYERMESVMTYLEAHPELFKEKNYDDSRTRDPKLDVDDSWEDEEEEW